MGPTGKQKNIFIKIFGCWSYEVLYRVAQGQGQRVVVVVVEATRARLAPAQPNIYTIVMLDGKNKLAKTHMLAKDQVHEEDGGSETLLEVVPCLRDQIFCHKSVTLFSFHLEVVRNMASNNCWTGVSSC